MSSLEDFAKQKLEALERRALRRQLVHLSRVDAPTLQHGRQTHVSFACNDYLGLSRHPLVKAAAIDAIREYGAGAGASRLITGNHPLFEELEARLAALKQQPAALVFGSGYLVNLGVIPSLANPGDLILADELSHACLLAGAKISGARVVLFTHNDTAALRRLLENERGRHPRCLVVTEGVFSMDGDLAPLPALVPLCAEYDAWLLTDDAHGLGVVGAGRGSAFSCSPPAHAPLQVGTLSKAVGSYGGYVCAPKNVVELLKSRARTLVYSTGLPPASVAASIAALDIISQNPSLCSVPVEMASRFARGLQLPPPQSAIVPLHLGSPRRALLASERLAQAGFWVTAIRPPTVPEGSARLRLAFSALHTAEDVDRLIDAVRTHVLPLQEEAPCANGS